MAKVMTKTLIFKSDVIRNVDGRYTKDLRLYVPRKPHYEAIIIKPCNSIHTFSEVSH